MMFINKLLCVDENVFHLKFYSWHAHCTVFFVQKNIFTKITTLSSKKTFAKVLLRGDTRIDKSNVIINIFCKNPKECNSIICPQTPHSTHKLLRCLMRDCNL